MAEMCAPTKLWKKRKQKEKKDKEKKDKEKKEKEDKEKKEKRDKEKKDPFKLMAETSECRRSLICAPRLPFLSY